MMFAGILLALFATSVLARPDVSYAYEDEDESMHPDMNYRRSRAGDYEKTAEYWNNLAQDLIKEKTKPLNTNIAKNVILFLGDGMSVPTLQAARTYMGQLQGRTGEEAELSFEKLPYAGLSKTYCVNAQVADSACSATAYLSGVKANSGTIGVTAEVQRGNCSASLDESTHAKSVAVWSQLANKRTGVVTTTRVTHASPAGLYAHSARRSWETDEEVPPGCVDIATQLVHGETGKKLDVILGGGRRVFLPTGVRDEEGSSGRRTDGVNLIQQWIENKNGHQAQYVWNRSALLDVPDTTQHLLGLFDTNHMQYHLEASPVTEPTLEEMTETALKILSKNTDGYFLFVEGGRIDHAHHSNRPQLALDETVEFSKAVQKAIDLTDSEDTLIVVTADHSHVMTTSGYPSRGNDILGIAGRGADGISYATISYANGEGYRPEVDGVRHDVSLDDRWAVRYRFPAMVPRSSETHGADDVPIWAVGPWAHLFSGTMEQSVLPHIIGFASCVGNGLKACDDEMIAAKSKS